MRALPLLLSGLLLSIAALPAQAVQSTSNSTLSMTVVSACRIASASSLNFGRYDSIGTHSFQSLDSSGVIGVVCTNGTSTARVSLSQGSNSEPGSSCANPLRRMRNSQGSWLSYRIYRDLGKTQVWGCLPENSYLLPAFNRVLQPVNITTFGTVPAGQPAGVGDYVDTIEVVVTF